MSHAGNPLNNHSMHSTTTDTQSAGQAPALAPATCSAPTSIEDAITQRLNQGLLVLASWCRSRAMLSHNERTTRTMLRRKVDELFDAADRAGWAYTAKKMGKQLPQHLVSDLPNVSDEPRRP